MVHLRQLRYSHASLLQADMARQDVLRQSYLVPGYILAENYSDPSLFFRCCELFYHHHHHHHKHF